MIINNFGCDGKKDFQNEQGMLNFDSAYPEFIHNNKNFRSVFAIIYF